MRKYILFATILLVGLGVVRLQHTTQKTTRSLEKTVLTPRISDPTFIPDIQIADINGDNKPDIALTQVQVQQELIHLMNQPVTGSLSTTNIGKTLGKNAVTLYLSQANGGFSEMEVPIPNIPGDPSEITLQDIDKDGDVDVLVGALGELPPTVKQVGSVLVLENRLRTNEHFVLHTIEEGVNRVVKVYAKDLDRDNDNDLLVAAFGGNTPPNDDYVGDIHWLENKGDWQFAPHPVMDAQGPISIVDISSLYNNVSPVLAVLISQDAEEVVSLDFDDPKNVKTKVLYKQNRKDWGSVRLELADLDQDNIKDIVWINGDSFGESAKEKNSMHGISWLKKQNDGSFAYKEVGKLAGAHHGLPVDFDGDGDIDIISSVFHTLGGSEIMLFENFGKGIFGPARPVSKGIKNVAAMAVADLTNDSKPDIVLQEITDLTLYLLR